MRAPIFGLFGLVLLAFAGCSRSSGNFSAVSDDDAAMNEAIAKAKATSGQFVEALRARKPGTKDFYVKKPYKTPDDGHEHMWVEISAEKDGVLEGTVANEPQHTTEVNWGQKVSVDLSEISDWKYQDGNKLIGGYTIRYFVNQMSAAEKQEFLAQAGFEL